MHREETPGMPSLPPVSELRKEHRLIERVLTVLESLVKRARGGEGFEAESLGRAVEFFRLFADACHHAKEENLLFPVLEARGIPRQDGPIGVMLEEHRLARGFTREMADALGDREASGAAADERFLAAADHYLVLLRNHIFKEDNVLFAMGDQVMTDDDRHRLGLQFCDVGCQAFDGQTRDELEAIAERLEVEWPAAG